MHLTFLQMGMYLYDINITTFYFVLQIYVHDTLETLYQFIPKNVLPDQYGGTAGDLEKIVGKYLLI